MGGFERFVWMISPDTLGDFKDVVGPFAKESNLTLFLKWS